LIISSKISGGFIDSERKCKICVQIDPCEHLVTVYSKLMAGNLNQFIAHDTSKQNGNTMWYLNFRSVSKFIWNLQFLYHAIYKH